MTKERLAELRALAGKQPGQKSAAIFELIEEVQKLRRRRDVTKGPTFEEVAAYGKEIGLNARKVESFFDYHEARGWRMGKSGTAPIRNFQAAMRTWLRMDAKFSNPLSNGSDPDGWQQFLTTSNAIYRGDFRHAPEYLRLDFSRAKKAKK
jgi:hypothetical protein